MPEFADSEGGVSDLNELRSTLDTLTDGSPIRQTKAKTYTSSAQDWRFKEVPNNR